MGIFDKFKRRPNAAYEQPPADPPGADPRPGGDSRPADGLRSGGVLGSADRPRPAAAPGSAADLQAAAEAPVADPAQQVADLREQVELWVRPGFLSRADVLEYARDFRDDDEVPLDDEQLAQLVEDVWQARLAEQASWPAYTDADRVAAAFAELDANGVVARMNFTCCQNCGVTEIDDERPTDRPSIGYVFFHQQDAERLAEEPAQLYLAYGTLEPEQGRVAEQDQAVGEQIRAALLAQDLPVEWDGSAAQRISVGPITWHRRLP